MCAHIYQIEMNLSSMNHQKADWDPEQKFWMFRELCEATPRTILQGDDRFCMTPTPAPDKVVVHDK